MKKYLIIPIFLACALSNAMERQPQNQHEQGRPTRHYTLDDLRQGSTAPEFELLGNTQPQPANIDPAHLALFGLREGYTVSQLLGRYNLYECTTAEEMNRMYVAFSALYPYAMNDQQSQQQSEIADENYQLPETYDAMETDISNNSDTIENAHVIENNLLGEVESHHLHEAASQYDQWIEQLCHEIEQAIQFGVQDDRILHNITTYLFGHENYTTVPRNEWFDLPPYSTFQTEWQTSITTQSNSDRPDYTRLVGANDSVKGIYTSVTSVKVMYKYDMLGRLTLKFRHTRRKFIVTKLNNYYQVNDDDDYDDSAPTRTDN